MSQKILVTPEQLEQVSNSFKQSKEVANQQIVQLQQRIRSLEGQWNGITQQRFFQEFEQCKKTMQDYVELMNKITVDLNKIAKRFREADSALLGSGSSASAFAGATSGTRNASLGVNAGGQTNEIPISSIGNRSFLIKNEENGLFTGAIGGEFDASFSEGLTANGVVAEAGYEGDYAEGSVSLAEGNLEANIKDGNLNLGAEATLNKYEGGFKIPLPFTDKRLNIGGSASLGIVGGSVHVGKEGMKVHIPLGPGASLFGIGGEISIK